MNPADIPTISSISALRSFAAVSQYSGYNVFLSGGSTPGDGYQGSFYVSTNNPGPDDGDNYIYSNISGYYFIRQTGSARLKYVSPSSSVGDIQDTITASAGTGLVFRPGTYPNANYVFPSNVEIMSSGPVLFQNSSNSVPCLDLSGQSNINFHGQFKIQGNGGLTNSGQIGIKLFNTLNLEIGGIMEITDINGHGIDEEAPSSSFLVLGSNNFSGVRAHGNYFGKYVHNFAEYSTDIGGFYYGNVAGISCESGNRTFVGVNIVDNTYGYFFQTVSPANNGHGNVVGGAVNHNTNAFVFDGISTGFLVTGTQIIATAASTATSINLVNGSKLIQFANCGMAAAITIDATSECSVQSCGFRTDLSGVVAPVVASGGVYIGKGNFNATGLLGAGWNN